VNSFAVSYYYQIGTVAPALPINEVTTETIEATATFIADNSMNRAIESSSTW
jgi:hypothetical protein